MAWYNCNVIILEMKTRGARKVILALLGFVFLSLFFSVRVIFFLDQEIIKITHQVGMRRICGLRGDLDLLINNIEFFS